MIKKYCSICNVLVVEVVKGKAKKDIYIECNKCHEESKPNHDMPSGFDEIWRNSFKKI